MESIKSENDVLTTLSYALNMESPLTSTLANLSDLSIEGLDCSHFAGEHAVAAFARFDGSTESSGQHKVYNLPVNLVNPSDDYEGIPSSDFKKMPIADASAGCYLSRWWSRSVKSRKRCARS